MTDKVNISPGHANKPPSTAQAIRHAGGEFVVPSTTTLIADYYTDMTAGPYNAFNHASTTGLDVVIDTGEAVVNGACIAVDAQTTVTLPANATTKLYVGWETQSKNNAIIGPSSAFTANAFTLEIWEFTTDGTTWTSKTDLRKTDWGINRKNRRYETSDSSGAKVDKAKVADTATSADSATNATNADNATTAGDADTVDGLHATDLASSSHSHAHSDLTTIGASDHHAKYTDAEAVAAVEASGSPLAIDISGDAATVDGISIYVQATEPTGASENDIWIDTS